MTLAVLLQSLYKNQEEDDLELQGVGSNGQQHSMGNGNPALGGNGQMGGSWLLANIAAGQAIVWVAAPGHCMKSGCRCAACLQNPLQRWATTALTAMG